MALLFVGSRFIKYPEILKATIIVNVKEKSSDGNHEENSYNGKIILPRRGAGKVKAGQKVNLKFEEYPYMEYGFVQVRLSNISMVPYEDSNLGKVYILEVELPDSLITQYKKLIPYQSEMTGIAKIITEDITVFDRFLNPIRAVMR